MKFINLLVSAAALVLIASCTGVLKHVDPFVGTSYTGHTFPGASYPFGMIQAGPETGWDTWDYCGGYRHEDTLILGFSQDRISGTGCPDLGDIRVMPYGVALRDDFSSAFDKSSEKATPGYYSVHLTDNAVLVDITCSRHTAAYKFKYDTDERNVMVDFSRIVGQKNRVTSADVKLVDPYTLEGSSHIKGWVERDIYYVLKFSEPVEGCETRAMRETSQYVLSFKSARKPLLLKVALSTVSTAGARANMDAEIPNWNFSKTLSEARSAWKQCLGVATIKGTDDEKMNFYTSLYHLFIQPNNIADVDGLYNGADNKVHQSISGEHYSTLSQWDTYRAADPLYSLLLPETAAGIVNSMIEQCDEKGHLPIWALCGKENYCMVGNHSVPVVAEAAINGLPGVDPERAYAAIRRSLTESHRNSPWEVYDKYGYLPIDIVPRESVSRTLEMGYDDYCAARLAEKLGKTEDVAFFDGRSAYYKNLFDSTSGLMRGRDSEGRWRDPFTPFAYSHEGSHGGDYTEGNAWQYSWHVLQDVPGLIALMGGKDAFVAKLDSLFTAHPDESQTGHVLDVTGLIGQYAHGNEPCHHIAYLYALAGRPDRTQEVVRQVFDQFYLPRIDGLCGNDDCGQMSAWYIFSACGFYPVNPVSGEFVLGAPQVPEVCLNLPSGKKFVVKAENLSKVNKYVESVTLNGSELDGIITRDQILAGGQLIFKMKNN